MFKFKKENLYNYLLLLLASAFLIYFYGAILMSPNDILFSKFGDGFSQYYNFTYFIKHNQDYFDYTGASYPYGEHFVYFDGQPFFASFFKFWSSYFPFIKNYTVGILNSLVLFSLWWTPFLLYGILLRLNIRPLLAVLGAMGILALEPQVFRLLGHYSLSYSCAIPLSLYLLLRVREGKKVVQWVFWLMFTNIIWLFTHPYLGLMCCLLIGSIWFFYWLWQFKKLSKSYKNYLFPVLTVLLPIVVFQLTINLTDTHTAKAENVFGIAVFCGQPDDVFIPNHPPFKPILDSMLSSPFKQTWEGLAYVGATTILSLLVALLIWLIRKVLKKKSPLEEPVNSIVWVAFWASIPLLLLSWAFPFLQFPGLLDYIPAIKQFRSLGRFAWPFYYISTLTSIYLIHRAALTLQLHKQKVLAGVLIVAAPLLYMVEGYTPHAEVSTLISTTPNYFIEAHRPEIFKEGFSKFDASKYQAILPLPFYYLGSGNYYRLTHGGSMHMATITSVHTGLPTISAAISRGDVWESRNLMQLISPPYYDKKVKVDMPSKKPILITRSSHQEKLTSYEQKILDRCRLIACDELGNGFYEIDFDDLFIDEREAVFEQFEKTRDLLHQRDGWLLQDSTIFLLHDDFETQESEIAFKGKGAFSKPKKGRYVIKEFAPCPENKTMRQRYHLSAWVYNGAIDAMNYSFIIAESSRNNKNQKTIGIARPQEALTINGDWSLIEFSFWAPANTYDKIQIIYYSKLESKANIYIDNLLIYTTPSELGAAKTRNVYKVESTKNGRVDELRYNGHQLIRKENN